MTTTPMPEGQGVPVAVPVDPNAKPKIEQKVKVSTLTAGGVAAIVLAGLSVIQSDQLINGVPDWVPVVIGALITALTTFTGGYNAPHESRNDLPAAER